MSIKSELIMLAERGGGILKPEAGVAWAAANKESALYKALPWNDAAAAHAHRLHVMRQLIEIHVVNDTTGQREMVSLSIDRTAEGGGYRPLEAVMKNVEWRNLLVQDALAELRRLQAKYKQLQELKKVWDALDSVKEEETV